MDLFSKQKFTTWAIAILVVLNIVTLYTLWSSKNETLPGPILGQAQRPDPLVNELLKEELNLSDEQYKQIVILREEHHRQSRQLSKETHDLKKELMDQLFENSDPIAIELLTNEIGENRTAFELGVFNHFKEIQTILTPEQNEKFENLLLRVTGKAGVPHNRPPLGGPPQRQ